MRKYIEVYPWAIEDAVKEGDTIYILDKGVALNDPIIIANNLYASDFFILISKMKENKRGRYIAWKVITAAEDEGDGTNVEDIDKIFG